MTPGVDLRFVDVDGSKVRVLTREGSAGGPPLLLINGIGARLELWEPFSAAVPDRPLLMFDLPGISGCPALDLALDMPGLAQWLTRLLDVLGADKVDVLGYSWGGILAQQFARNAPERMRALVLACTNDGFVAAPALRMVPLYSLFPNTVGDDPLRLLSAALGGDLRHRSPISSLFNWLNPARSPLGGYQRQVVALTGWSSHPWLSELKSPTLLIASDDDPFVPRQTVDRMTENIPDSALAIVDGGGHLLPVNQPARMARIVDTFLRNVPTDDSGR